MDEDLSGPGHNATTSNHPFKTIGPDSDLGSGHWFACDYPERPAELMTVFRTGCEACQMALEVALQVPGSGWTGKREEVDRLRLHAITSGRAVTIGRKA
jgi:hypothetical protein